MLENVNYSSNGVACMRIPSGASLAHRDGLSFIAFLFASIAMTTLTSASTAIADPAPAPKRKRSPLTDTTLYAVLAILIIAAWRFARMGYFQPGDDVGYWIGVTGGVMMLLLLLYPLRKYVSFMQRLGKVKYWFLVHMLLGIGGPLLIMIHSTFHLGSLNAAVAMLSMLIVAGSGIVGRFLYLRIHKGLNGERSNLAELQRRAGLAQGEVRSRFRFAPGVAERLMAFEAMATEEGNGWGITLFRVFWLPVRQRIEYDKCAREVDAKLRIIGKDSGWTRGQLRRRSAQARHATRVYLRSVVRVAQLSAYERLFALWHLLHAPFVYLLVLTAGFHVFAVHAY